MKEMQGSERWYNATMITIGTIERAEDIDLRIMDGNALRYRRAFALLIIDAVQ